MGPPVESLTNSPAQAAQPRPVVERKAWQVKASEAGPESTMRERLKSLPRTPSECMLEMLCEMTRDEAASPDGKVKEPGHPAPPHAWLINLDGTTAQVAHASIPKVTNKHAAGRAGPDTNKMLDGPKDQLITAAARIVQQVSFRKPARNSTAHSAAVLPAPAPQQPSVARARPQAVPEAAPQDEARSAVVQEQLTSPSTSKPNPEARESSTLTAAIQPAIDSLLHLLKAQQWQGEAGGAGLPSSRAGDVLIPDLMQLLCSHQPGAARPACQATEATALNSQGAPQPAAAPGSGQQDTDEASDVAHQLQSMHERGHNLLIGAAVEAVQSLRRVLACAGMLEGMSHLKTACHSLAAGCGDVSHSFDQYHTTCTTWQAPAAQPVVQGPDTAQHTAARAMDSIVVHEQPGDGYASAPTGAGVNLEAAQACSVQQGSKAPGVQAGRHRSHRWRLRTNPMYEGEDDVTESDNQKHKLRGSTGQLVECCAGMSTVVQDQHSRPASYRMRRLSELQGVEVQGVGHGQRDGVQGPGDSTLDGMGLQQAEASWVGRAFQKLADEVEALAQTCYCHWLEHHVVGAEPGKDRVQCQQLLVHMQKGRRWLAKVSKRIQQRCSSSHEGYFPGGRLPDLCIRKPGAGVLRLPSADCHVDVLLSRLAALSAQLQGAQRATLALLTRSAAQPAASIQC